MVMTWIHELFQEVNYFCPTHQTMFVIWQSSNSCKNKKKNEGKIKEKIKIYSSAKLVLVGATFQNLCHYYLIFELL